MPEAQLSPLHSPPSTLGSPRDYRIPWSDFVRLVIDVTVRAYQKMRLDGVARKDWDENTFTVKLTVDYIGPLGYGYGLYAIPRVRAHSAEMKDGLASPSRAPEIDIKLFGSWERDYDRVYFAWECKRVCDRLADRELAFLIPEYVSEGVERFIQGEYASDVDDAGMLGYVLAGRIPDIVKSINQSMLDAHRKRRLSSADHLRASVPISAFPDVYESLHQRRTGDTKIRLHHLFLGFDFS